ncbi:Uma2 family endonuclease [Planctomycetota bacterium]
MSVGLRLTAEEYDRMIAKGAFNGINRPIEMIRGELREMNPAGPVHEDYIDFLTRWSTQATSPSDCVVRIQSSIDLDDSRPGPDVTWLKPGRYASRRPRAEDVLLLIEVADSSLPSDLSEKAELYAEFGVAEYWVVDVHGKCIPTRIDKTPTMTLDN